MNSSQKNHRKDFFYIKICRNDVSGEAEEIWLILENVFCREVVGQIMVYHSCPAKEREARYGFLRVSRGLVSGSQAYEWDFEDC